MPLVRHRFGDFLHPETEIVLLGTFNPDTACNPATFFYSRRQNHLWRILPEAFGHRSLQKADAEVKRAFALQCKIGFMDVIEVVNVSGGQECNYQDTYLDDKVVCWNDVISKLKDHHKVSKILFTRKSFSGISNIFRKVSSIEEYCRKVGIQFHVLPSPARIYTPEKCKLWKHSLIGSSPEPHRASGTLQDSPSQRYK